MNANIQYVTVTSESAALLAALCRRRNARVQIHIQARDVSARLNKVEEKDALAKAAAAMYEAFAVAAEVRIRQYDFEQRNRGYCKNIQDDMAD